MQYNFQKRHTFLIKNNIFNSIYRYYDKISTNHWNAIVDALTLKCYHIIFCSFYVKNDIDLCYICIYTNHKRRMIEIFILTKFYLQFKYKTQNKNQENVNACTKQQSRAETNVETCARI